MRDIKVVVIGASAGGLEALRSVLPSFKKPSKLSAFLVLHLPPTGPNLIPELFEDSCEFQVKEAESGEDIRPETIYIAPPNFHMSLEANGSISLSQEEPVNYSRPSIDILFESAALSYKSNVMGILLTGANHDGAQGLHLIAKKHGLTVVQDPNACEYAAMPLSAISLFKPDHVLNLVELKKFIMEMKRG